MCVCVLYTVDVRGEPCAALNEGEGTCPVFSTQAKEENQIGYRNAVTAHPYYSTIEYTTG